MRVTCDKCGKAYDDVYRWTYCPHERFEMNTTVVDGTGKSEVAHSFPAPLLAYLSVCSWFVGSN